MQSATRAEQRRIVNGDSAEETPGVDEPVPKKCDARNSGSPDGQRPSWNAHLCIHEQGYRHRSPSGNQETTQSLQTPQPIRPEQYVDEEVSCQLADSALARNPTPRTIAAAATAWTPATAASTNRAASLAPYIAAKPLQTVNRNATTCGSRTLPKAPLP